MIRLGLFLKSGSADWKSLTSLLTEEVSYLLFKFKFNLIRGGLARLTDIVVAWLGLIVVSSRVVTGCCYCCCYGSLFLCERLQVFLSGSLIFFWSPG